ncbi:MAG: hypothetical protein KQI35_12875 [Bacteroidetes bacterium]|nr:hypothetical protein [Bacteroidota bacterium]
MRDQICPNYDVCKLVTTEGFSGNEVRRQAYLTDFCHASESKWSNCSRYVTKKALNFCPDFVLPDTAMTLDEIIDKFDELNQ